MLFIAEIGGICTNTPENKTHVLSDVFACYILLTQLYFPFRIKSKFYGLVKEGSPLYVKLQYKYYIKFPQLFTLKAIIFDYGLITVGERLIKLQSAGSQYQ